MTFSLPLPAQAEVFCFIMLNFIQIFTMRISLVIIIVLSILSGTSFAQQAKVKRFTAPLSGTVVLRDVEDKYNAGVYSMEMPEPDADAEQQKLRAIKERISSDYPHKKKAAYKTTTGALAPVVGVNFIADSFSGIPPDNYTAISNGNKAVSVMNSSIAIHDATTGAYLSRTTLRLFSFAVGLNNSTYDYRYDPKVMYDPEADRFISVILNGTNQYNWIVMGFSATNDPAGAWHFYKFYGDYTGDTTWFDYPSISMTKNDFFLTGNKIKYNTSWQAGFTRTLIYQVRKQDGYDGDSLLTYQIWDSVQYNNKSIRCLHPVKPGNALQGPAQYFLSDRNFDINNDTVFLVKVPDTTGSADSVLSVTALVSSTGSYGVPPNGRQPDTATDLATNDGRILGAYIKDDQIQFVSASLDTSFGSSGVYHGIINNVSTTPALTGRLYSIDTLDFGYPNISYAGNNQSIISFNYSGPHTNPGFGAVLYDGTSYSPMVNIKSGDSSIRYNISGPELQRWGDYSGSQPDWTTPGSVWVLGIFGRKDRKYGNYMARLTSPYYQGVPAVAPKAQPVNLYPNPAMEYVEFEFNVAKEQAFSFFIYDMQGRQVDKIADNFCHDGKNIIQFNIASLPPGTYMLKANGSLGEQISVHRFVKR